jgi:hypothetical protein
VTWTDAAAETLRYRAGKSPPGFYFPASRALSCSSAREKPYARAAEHTRTVARCAVAGRENERERGRDPSCPSEREEMLTWEQEESDVGAGPASAPSSRLACRDPGMYC